jgi:UDP-N-acetylglucosamine pyrophosphorylase
MEPTLSNQPIVDQDSLSQTIQFSNQTIEKMQELSIDPHLTQKRLNALNSGKYDNVEPMKATAIPKIDGDKVVDIHSQDEFNFNYALVQSRIDELNLSLDLKNYGNFKESDESILFSKAQLSRLGIALAPVISYGVLNGGSASSYVDKKKNKKAFGKLFDIYEKYFSKMIPLAKGKPKGLTPAYINEDGSVGEPFFKLKLRALLIKTLKYMSLHNLESVKNPYQVFQMDSILNSEEISQALQQYSNDPLLVDLMTATGNTMTNVYTGSQPLLAALTHEGKPYDVFTNAHGQDNSLIPMPAGHGHNFEVLKDVYQKLHSEGKRFAYLTNIDNLANTVNDAAVAYLALTGKHAGFEFSVKTPADTKGGIALIDQFGKLNCGDMGVAIPHDVVNDFESRGNKILFNTAIGLFDLNYLISKLDDIIENLPMRHSVQDKDSGKYSQLEQVTWEVLGMIENPVIFAVDKYDRFLAAKTLIEGLMASGLDLNHPDFPEQFNKIAGSMSKSLRQKMNSDFGMKQINGKWVPKSVDELKSEFKE